MTTRAYKLRIYPSVEQRHALNQWFGASRWTWNRCLEFRSKAYKRRGESVTGVDFSRLLTQLKKTDRYAWLKRVPFTVLTQKMRDQDQAFNNFFQGRASYPRFRKKLNAQSARLQLDTRNKTCIKAWAAGEVFVPGVGQIKHRGRNHPKIPPKMVTVRRNACGQYFVSFMVEVTIRPFRKTKKTIGVDVGLKELVVTSDGDKFDNPRHFRVRLRRLRRAQRALSRRVKGSNRYKRKRQEVAKLHQKVTDARRDALHKLTSKLIRENQVVGSVLIKG